jgi:hypothetical protein
VRVAVATLGLLLAGCGDKDRPPAFFGDLPETATQDVSGATFDTPATEVSINCSAGPEAGVCACSEIGQKPTSLYVVLDRSGSMLARDGGSQTRWDVTTLALLHAKQGVLRKLGSRVTVGLALFPDTGASSDGCKTGAEFLAPTVGSPATYDKIVEILRFAAPSVGATPTAPTMVSLASKLKALPQPAFVLLATDGAPNCGTTTCTVDRCTYNVEHAPLDGGRFCDDSVNCCDPKQVSGGMGWGACIDADATRVAVAELAAAGIKTFVFGVPGVGPYSADLDGLATAGGTAREDAKPGEPLYYAASATTQEAFVTALSAVAAKVVDTCTITLDSVPSDPGITNVLVDGALIPQDPIDGWAWTADGKVELRGATCAKVKAGDVVRVQVAVGCKTVTK